MFGRRRFAHGRRRPGQMNKTEMAYSQVLEGLRIGNKIEWYSFEAIKLKLADNTSYTPDFFVMRASGELECIDVKGGKVKKNEQGMTTGSKPWVEEDAMVKIKCAAEKFPFIFKMVWYTRSGGWVEKEI